MQLRPKIIFIILSGLFIISVPCHAQKKDAKPYPVAVLVQLRSEHNRIEGLTKAGRYKDVEEVEHDALEVKRRMILDFHNNFTYCPVYYYIDTNADLIKQKIFDGTLLNEDGSPVKNPVISSASDDYVIAYYGYAISQGPRTRVQTDTSRVTLDPDPPNGIGLVILNDKFLQLSYFYKLGYYGIFAGKRYFSSKHFDIEYYPLVHQFNSTVLHHNRSHKRG